MKAKWIKETLVLPLSDATKDCVKCSNCKLHYDCESKFCPNCGADMTDDKEIDTKDNEDFEMILAKAVIVTGEGINAIAEHHNKTKEETLELFIEGLRINAGLDNLDDFLTWLEKEELI